MSNTRPTLARTITRASEKKRRSTLDEGVSITVDGATYTVRAGDLTAMDTRDLRRELGLSFVGLMGALSTDPDIDLIAGLIWLARRINGERMSYESIAAELGYDAVDGLEVVAASEVVEGELGPEG